MHIGLRCSETAYRESRPAITKRDCERFLSRGIIHDDEVYDDKESDVTESSPKPTGTDSSCSCSAAVGLVCLHAIHRRSHTAHRQTSTPHGGGLTSSQAVVQARFTTDKCQAVVELEGTRVRHKKPARQARRCAGVACQATRSPPMQLQPPAFDLLTHRASSPP